MNGDQLATAAHARLAAQIPTWPRYLHGVPDGNLPARYLVVRSSEGSEERTRAAGSTTIQSPSLWIAGSVRHDDGQFAAKELAAVMAQVRATLRDWRPESRWALRPVGSQPAIRNEALPETTFYAVEQFRLRSSI